MKLMNYLALVSAAASLAVGSAQAQTNVASTQPVRDGKVVVPDHPTANDANVTPASNIRPARPERPNLPPEVQARIERFKQDARAYLARQEALKKQLQGATDQERAAIRDQLKELREQWLERAREMRKEYKERQAELADKLTDYRELLDSTRSPALQDAGGRKRRGED